MVHDKELINFEGGKEKAWSFFSLIITSCMLFVKRNIDKLTKIQCNSQVVISSIRSKELMHLTRTILHASILSMKVREQLKSLRKQCKMLNSRLLAMVEAFARLLLSAI